MADAHRDLQLLGRLAAAVGPALAPVGHQRQLTDMAETALAVFGAKACSIAVVDADEENLVFTAAAGLGADDVLGLSVPVGQGIAGWVVSSGQTIEVTEVERDPRFARDVAERTGYVPHAILAAPLETEQRVLGAIEVLDRDADRPGSIRDLVVLDFFARHAAIALASARLFSDMGRVLLNALATDGEDDLERALSTAAGSLQVDPGLADLAALLGRLGRAGAAERELAVDLLSEVLAYTDRRGPA
ncbi:MAG: GAF domain-containing protein [Sporichthyaceae bacterium]